MILTKNSNVTITSRNIGYYINYFNDIKINDVINVDINILHKGSNLKINVCCDNCGQEKEVSYVKYNNYIKDDGKYYCKDCKWIKYKETNIKRYGVTNPLKKMELKEKIKKSLIDKYGVDNPMKDKNIKEKVKNTINEKYGVDNVFQNDEIKEKIKNTNLLKYGIESHNKNEKIKEHKKNTYLKNFGYENVFSSPEIIDKIKEILIDKYGVDNIFKNGIIRDKFINENKIKWFNEIKNKYKNLNFINADFVKKEFQINCDKGHTFNITFNLFYNRNRENCKTEICTICNPIDKQESGLEIQIRDFIKENYDGIIELNNNIIINPYEIDIYLPELKIGFEFNGLYWHSEIYKDKNYHINKTNISESKEIKLIQIYEDDWLYKQDIVKSRILNLLGKSNKIMARKTEIKEFNDTKMIKDFLDKNHIQGHVGSKIKIGLFYENKLVSLMTFGDKRKLMGQKSVVGTYEMLRFCNILNTNVIGGASRLFKYFVDKYNPNVVISYADRSWSNGNLYKKIGFDFIRKTEPNYYYIINGKRKHRFVFRKDKLIKDGADPSKTEHEIMLEKNIYRIYDSGHLKFIWKNNKKTNLTEKN